MNFLPSCFNAGVEEWTAVRERGAEIEKNEKDKIERRNSGLLGSRGSSFEQSSINSQHGELFERKV
jgi:hypothetical protein